ncbi:hypothetical protein [Mucilaginibacter rubeus]|uniref:hypothetical protein n=1 Tax=Mucilaginibacter rubeus TaxID=2027860 RepID=UPI00166C5971|nr:hypothetical protein [Mucilaginibacter rubeus]GGA95750.1 hypothetical protein GCM10011500_09410 [Mucilaginibacter rubeus]
MDISELNRAPFTSLPVNEGDLFDLTAEFLRAKLIDAIESYSKVESLASELTADTINFSQDYKLFKAIDDFVIEYAQVIRCVKLSLGIADGKVKNPQKVFEKFNYDNLDKLHEDIIGLRNTSEHFEERLQEFGHQAEPFLQLSYEGDYYRWQSSFGVGGFKKSGSGMSDKEMFNEKKLWFRSYKITGSKKSRKITSVNLRLHDMITDIKQVCRLLGNNIVAAIDKKGECCPPVRDLSIFLVPDDNES